MDATASSDIFVVSNRLPVRLVRAEGGYDAVRSAGGLATALRTVRGVRRWIGWPGAPVETRHRAAVTARLEQLGLGPVFLSVEEERHHYSHMCNGVLWPLLHYYPGRIEFEPKAWPTYRAINERFAAAVAAQASQGAVVWVHDFHLFLVPQLLRALRPDLSIGFFLHVPFPSQELWRILPQREELLLGLLGADYLGFHTADYLRHFRNACLRVLGLDAPPDAVIAGGNRTALGVDPLGPDVQSFAQLLDGDEVAAHLDRCQRQWGDRRLVLGVERLDYSKGILHKLQAFAELLEHEPERAADTVMLQVLVPSREENESYKSLLHQIQREVGRINGRFGSPGRMPLEFLHRSVEPAELAALYRHASVGLVTPVRDGMNLVAHEFVYCQGHPRPAGSQHRGTLVLSEFAGAALSLTRAVQVNPWDITGLARAIGQALRLPPEDRSERIAELYDRTVELDSARWADRFLGRLATAAAYNRRHRPAPMAVAERRSLVRRWREAPGRRLFLDYDGTLREIAQRPEQAAPSPSLRALLQRLAMRPGTAVHLVSGRRFQTLDTWFGSLPLHLCAEHGLLHRPLGGRWQRIGAPDLGWMPRVQALLQELCDQVPGSFVENKTCSVAWHYRLADPGYGSWRARELKSQLDEMLANAAAETLSGHAVLEVRAKGIDKGSYVRARMQDLVPGEFVFAAGDDRTDLDMYRALPDDAFRVHVGGAVAEAQHAMATPTDLRALLSEFAEA